MARNQAAFAQMGDDEATGSIAALSHARPTDTDLAFARTAASDVLTKGNKDASQPWENPSTGARGSVTPLAQTYSAEGRTCRIFWRVTLTEVRKLVAGGGVQSPRRSVGNPIPQTLAKLMQNGSWE